MAEYRHLDRTCPLAFPLELNDAASYNFETSLPWYHIPAHWWNQSQVNAAHVLS